MSALTCSTQSPSEASMVCVAPNSVPFAWTKTADQILKKANRQKTSDAGR